MASNALNRAVMGEQNWGNFNPAKQGPMGQKDQWGRPPGDPQYGQDPNAKSQIAPNSAPEGGGGLSGGLYGRPGQGLGDLPPNPRQYGTPEDVLSRAKLRGGGTGGVGSGALSGAGIGSTVGSIIPGVGTAVGGAIGAGVGALGGMLNKKAASAPGDIGVGDAGNSIRAAYQTYLGRDAQDSEVGTHLTSQGLKPGGRWVGQQGLAGVLTNIQNSPEAKAFQQKAALEQAIVPPPPQDEATPIMPRPATSGTKGGFRSQLEGFGDDKLNSDHDSPKYTFARIAQNFDVRDPAQREQMLAALRADPSGYFKNATLGGSKGDKLIIGGQLDDKFGGINTFDVIRAAGEGGKGWQWGPEGGPEATATSALPAAITYGANVNPITMGQEWLKKLFAQLGVSNG